LCSLFLDWPDWWTHINYEGGALTWFSSVQLVVLGLVSFAIYLLFGLPPASSSKVNGFRVVWLVLTLAFAFLSVDERFQIHERFRDNVLIPREIGTQLPGIGPGDFLLIIYAFCGLGVFCLLLPILKKSSTAVRWFVFGLVLALISVFIDSLEFYHDDFWRFQGYQMAEEVSETFAQMSMLIALVHLAQCRLEEVIGGGR
jgi:hypothetical protein